MTLPLGLWRDNLKPLCLIALIGGVATGFVESAVLKDQTTREVISTTLLMALPYALGFVVSACIVPALPILDPEQPAFLRWLAFCAMGCVGAALIIFAGLTGIGPRGAEVSVFLPEPALAFALVQPVWSAVYLLGRRLPPPKPVAA